MECFLSVMCQEYNGILFSYIKDCIWISSNEVDNTGAYYTEWNKSERKTPIQDINAYIWNLEGWYWWPYMQDSKRDTDVNNRLLDSVGEGKGGMIWENSIETCILQYVKQITSPGYTVLRASALGMTSRDGMGKEVGGGFRMGDTCTPMADSYQCMAKTTTVL